jgi:hypothetical protein
LVARLSRDALFVLCSAQTSPTVRAAVEAKLAAGQRVMASTIRKMVFEPPIEKPPRKVYTCKRQA